MNKLKEISKHYNFTKRQEQRIEDLTKDTAIGYAKWLVDNYTVSFEGFGFPVFINHVEYTNEQLFNEYLNTLK